MPVSDRDQRGDATVPKIGLIPAVPVEKRSKRRVHVGLIVELNPSLSLVVTLDTGLVAGPAIDLVVNHVVGGIMTWCSFDVAIPMAGWLTSYG